MGHWRRNMFELARHHSVYALDLLGFGASEKADTSYSIELWVEQIYDFWQAHVKVPAVLVGNSIGLIVCLAAAAAHPELAKGVATIGLPNLSSPPSSYWLLRVMTHQLQQLLTSRTSRLVLQPLFHLLRQPWVIRGWLQLAYVRSDEITDELLEILTAPTRDRGAAQAFCAVLASMVSPEFSPNIPTILSSLQIPTLLLWGTRDRFTPITAACQLLESNPSLQLIKLENVGHCAHDECPERVNFELLNWIQTQVNPIRN